MIIVGIVVLLVIMCILLFECLSHPLLRETIIPHFSHRSGIQAIKGGKEENSKGHGGQITSIYSPDPDVEKKNNRTIVQSFEGKSIESIYTYDQIPPMESNYGDNMIKYACHSGQRKLLLTEIEFLTYVKPKLPDLKLVVYAGSAPCEHISILLKMFPDLKFLLVDPNYHGIKEKYKYVYQNIDSISDDNFRIYQRDVSQKNKNPYTQRRYEHAKGLSQAEFTNGETFNVLDTFSSKNKRMNEIRDKFKEEHHTIRQLLEDDTRIYIIQDYMTNDLSKLISQSIADAGYPTNVFISDIRTTMFSSHGPQDLDIIWNDALQMMFLKNIKPDYSMLKFHPPLHLPTDDSVDKKGTSEIVSNDLEYVRKNYGADPLKQFADGKYPFLAHDKVFLQAWGTRAGTETRLIISQKNIEEPPVNYDYKEWLNKFWYMQKMRGLAYHGDLYEKVQKHANNKYAADFDSTLEMRILCWYLSESNDIDVLKSWLEDKENLNRLMGLRDFIDRNLLHNVSQKCPFYNQITKPPKNIILYKYQPTSLDFENITFDLFEIDPKTNKSKKINISGSKYLKVAKNVKTTSTETVKKQSESIRKKLIRSIKDNVITGNWFYQS